MAISLILSERWSTGRLAIADLSRTRYSAWNLFQNAFTVSDWYLNLLLKMTAPMSFRCLGRFDVSGSEVEPLYPNMKLVGVSALISLASVATAVRTR